MAAKPIKILLTGIVALILILIIIVCLLPYVVDSGVFTPLISAEVKKRTGRDLAFNGDIQLHIYPKLSLNTGPIVLGNPVDIPGTFLSVDNLSVGLQNGSLLAKQIHADTLHIQGVKLHLTTDPKGINNWDHGWPRSNDTSPTPWPSLLAGLAVEGLTIDNAQIIWDDQKAGQKIVVEQLNLKTGAFDISKPLHSQFSLTIRNVNNPMTAAIQGQSTVQLDESLAKITLLDNILQAKVTGAALPIKIANFGLLGQQMEINLAQKTLTAKALQFKGGDIAMISDISGQWADKHYQVSGKTQLAPVNPRAVMQQWGLALPKVSDNKALQHLEGVFSFLYSGNDSQQSLELKPLMITLDDSTLSGAVSVNFLPKPTAIAAIHIDTVNADRYLPPSDKPAKPTKPATALAGLPIETLRKLPITGTVAIHTLNIQGSCLENVLLTLHE